MTTGERDTAGVLAPPPVIYGVALAAGFVLEALLPSPDVSDAVAVPVGVVLLVAGGLLARAFIRAFRRARTPVNVSSPTTALVTTGPYRISRNPGYLGLALAYAGIAVLAHAAWVLAMLVPALIVVDRTVIAREERYLERRFGEEYSTYRRRTRRWL